MRPSSRAPVELEATLAQVRATATRFDRELGPELTKTLRESTATLERALEDALRLKRRERWLAENAAGMAAYNEDVETHGAFADTLRSF